MNDVKEIPFFKNESFFKENEKIYIQLSTEFPEYVGVLHKHQFIEIVYILSGSAIHTVGGKEYKIKAGDVILINCNTPHKFTPDKNSKESFIAYDLMFSPEFFDTTSLDIGDFRALKNCFLFISLFPSDEMFLPDMHIQGKVISSYGEIFSQIYNEYKYKEKGYIQLIRAFVIELIIKIFRDVEKQGIIELTTEKKDAVKQAIKYIEENYNMKLYVDDIASKVFFNGDYFRKIFKKETGESITSFQQKLRINEACRLLSTTEKPIKDICEIVGYSDMKAFYKVFKKVIGKTPNEYRTDQ